MNTLHAASTFTLTRSAHPRTAAEREALVANPRFGTVFTDHMARVRWNDAEGWHDREVVPYAALSLEPAAAVFHYAQEIFEGLKAYRHADGSIWCFRPEANARRMMMSAKRMALPSLSEEDFLGSIEALVTTDSDWVPVVADGGEASLYLRPFMFASEPFLGVRAANAVTYLCIASPVGAYFAKGVNPVSIWISEDYNRSGPGGTGAAKCGGNYAASLLPQAEGAEHGCDQVCFLDAATGQNLEELGGMNIFVVMRDGAIVTPGLTGTILPGITRDSIMQLLRDDGREVIERPINLAQWRAEIADGSVREVFACGTAAAVTPIGQIVGRGFTHVVGDGSAGELTMTLRNRLLDIQFGRVPDTHGWMRRIA